MAYEKITDLSTDTVVKLGGVDSKTGKKNPDSLEGYYLGSRTVKSENGTSTIHVFQTPKGNMGIWGSADTNTKLASVTLGTMTNVVFKGKIKIGGGKTKNTFDVFVDRDQTITVNAQAANHSENTSDNDDSSTGYEPGYDATSGYNDDVVDDSDNSVAEDAVQAAALAAAEKAAAQKAKMQEIMNRGKAGKKA